MCCASMDNCAWISRDSASIGLDRIYWSSLVVYDAL